MTYNEDSLSVSTRSLPNRGPYPFNQPKRNTVKFTPTQVEAIKSGINPGLTLIVGPPGTGKTDVAVQIVSNLYHNHPDQVRSFIYLLIYFDFLFFLSLAYTFDYSLKSRIKSNF